MLLLLSLLLTPLFGQCFLTNLKQNIIQSIIHDLNIKHSTIIKDPDFQPDIKIINFIKELSEKNIFASFLSPHQMSNSMDLYYNKPYEYYRDPNAYKFEHKLDQKRANLVYPPKTINLIKNFQGVINQIFKVSYQNVIVPKQKIFYLNKDFFSA